MQLTIIGSSSSGNAYLLSNEKEALLIECGVRVEKIKQALGYNMRKAVACIVTHEHKDHCKAVKEVMACGINVWATAGTHNAMGTGDSHRAKVCGVDNRFEVGGFTIKAFPIEHDCADPVGYLIRHQECGKVLFMTDTKYSEYTFPGLNNVIIEANYCQDIIDRRMKEEENPKFLRDRVIDSHMSLDTCKLTLQANDLSQVNNIVLIHLSSSNSDADRFKREVEQTTGKVVHVATPGMTIPFNKGPF
jgi:phosphoribosyl 1,2-cyclic phosphodiesterase